MLWSKQHRGWKKESKEREKKEGSLQSTCNGCAGRPLAVVIIKVLNRPWQVQNSWQPMGPALSFQGVRVTFRGGSALSDPKASLASHAPSPCPGALDGCPPAVKWNRRARPPSKIAKKTLSRKVTQFPYKNARTCQASLSKTPKEHTFLSMLLSYLIYIICSSDEK